MLKLATQTRKFSTLLWKDVKLAKPYTYSPRLFYNIPAFSFSNVKPQLHNQQLSKFSELQTEMEPEATPKAVYQNPENYIPKSYLREILVRGPMRISDFANKLKITKEAVLNGLKVLGSEKDANSVLSVSEMEMLALQNDCVVITEIKQKQQLNMRPPIVTIMGHVDHGKTTLLDRLRNSNMVDQEFGGITQKIGAFMVKNKEGKRITFIDTPGHEAFMNMRKRGAQCTDLVILVVAATDGIQPQTLEAYEHAKAAGVPIIIAINKIDRASPQEIEKDLVEHGIMIEPAGGNIPVIHISALKGTNIDLLEELILFEAEIRDIRADENRGAEGVVLEAKRAAEVECTVVLQQGVVQVGDYVVAGANYGKVKYIKNDLGESMDKALPGWAVQIGGLKDLPENGDPFIVVEDESKARTIARLREMNTQGFELDDANKKQIKGSKIKFSNSKERRKFHSGKDFIIRDKLTAIENEMLQKLEVLQKANEPDSINQIEQLKIDLEEHRAYQKEFIADINHDNAINFLLKASDKGTLETISAQFEKIVAKYPEYNVNIIRSSVGPVTENELHEAKMFRAQITGMDITCSADVARIAKHESIEIKNHRIIYELFDFIQKKLEVKKKSSAVEVAEVRGSATVKEIFSVKATGGSKTVAGLSVTKGKIFKKCKYRVIRAGKQLVENLEVSSLKLFKKETSEIAKGQECGLSLLGWDDLQKGDILEAYEMVKQE